MKMIDLDSEIVYTIEEHLIDNKRENLSKILSVGVAIYYATIDKAKDDERKVKKMKKKLELLRNQVSYYKGSPDVIIKFMEDIRE
jgi:hypothetical protein